MREAKDAAGRRAVSPSLVGRATELSALRSAVLAAPAAVVVEGEAGVGKTRLLTELRAQPQLRAHRFLVGWCRRIQEPFPLGPVIEAIRGLATAPATLGGGVSAVAGALRPLLPELADQLPPLPPPLDDRAAERHRVFRAVVELLGSLGPAVLVLEDLHWVDALTAEFIDYLLADPPAGLSLVMSFRGEEVSPRVRALTAKLPVTVGQTEIALRPLDRPATAALAAAILGVDQVPPALADHLHRYTSGLPFAVEELLALLQARGGHVPVPLPHPGGEPASAELDDLGVPVSIRNAVWERAADLSRPARAVLEAAAVLQVPGPAEVLLAAAQAQQEAQEEALEEVLAGGLLVEDGTTVGFRHLLAAQAVSMSLPGSRRRRLHGRAADALWSMQPAPLGRIAYHLRQAGRSAEWVQAAEQAADQAVALGHDAEAVRLLEEVLRHDLTQLRDSAQPSSSTQLSAAHRGALAITLARAALETAHVSAEVTGLLSKVLTYDLPAPVRGELAFRLALLQEAAGVDPLQVRALYAEAVTDLDGHHPQLRAWVMMGLAIPTGAAVPLAEHRRWLERVLRILPEVADRDPSFEIFLSGKAAMVLVLIGDPRWRELTERIVDVTGGVPRDRHEVNAYQSVAMAACYAGHLGEADRLLQAAQAAAITKESPKLTYRVRSALALLDYCRGRWEQLDGTVDTLLDQLSDFPVGRVDAGVVAGCLALARGDLPSAQQQLAAVAAEAEQVGGYELAALAVAALARLAVLRGQPGSAVRQVQGLLATVSGKRLPMPVVRLLPAAVQVLVADGQEPAAWALWSRYARALVGLDAPLAAAALTHAQGLLGAAAGRHRLAARQLLAAAAQYDGEQCGYEAAQAREQAAECLFASGQAQVFAQAGRALRSALVTYQRLGARWDRDRAAATARRHGVAVPARYRGGRRGYGDQLSPREQQVAELAAAGHTNKEIAQALFLSPKTVDKHVGAALRKLGLRSRAALTGRLHPPPARAEDLDDLPLDPGETISARKNGVPTP